MASMSRVTPFFSIEVSSSLTISSKVNPYWKPEQPPPWTKTRSFRSGLPSSSTSSLTLLAALSVKTSGAGGASSICGFETMFSATALMKGSGRTLGRLSQLGKGRTKARSRPKAASARQGRGSALAELLATAGAVQADLLALDLPRIAGHEAGAAEVALQGHV